MSIDFFVTYVLDLYTPLQGAFLCGWNCFWLMVVGGNRLESIAVRRCGFCGQGTFVVAG